MTQSNPKIKPVVGMHVRITCTQSELMFEYAPGIIRFIKNCGERMESIGVEFLENIDGHQLDGLLKNNNGWFITISKWNEGCFMIGKVNWEEAIKNGQK